MNLKSSSMILHPRWHGLLLQLIARAVATPQTAKRELTNLSAERYLFRLQHPHLRAGSRGR